MSLYYIFYKSIWRLTFHWVCIVKYLNLIVGINLKLIRIIVLNFFDNYWFFYILLLISSIAWSSYRIFLRERRIRNIQLFIFDVSCWFIYFFKFLIYLVLLHYLNLIIAFIHRFYYKLSTLIIEAEFYIIWNILNFESKKKPLTILKILITFFKKYFWSSWGSTEKRLTDWLHDWY